MRDGMQSTAVLREFKEEVKEAINAADINKTLNKYLDKVKDPAARVDFLTQAAIFLGKKSPVNIEDLDMVLRKHYVTKFDPAKLARQQGQTKDKAGQPPPLSTPGQPKFSPPPEGLPSLSQLAAKETDPVWKKYGLPPPLGGPVTKKEPTVSPPPVPSRTPPKLSIVPGGKPAVKAGEEDIPMASPKDVKTIRQKKSKEIDMPKLAAKERPAATAAAPERSTSPSSTAVRTPAKTEPTIPSTSQSLPMPSFSSLVKSKLSPEEQYKDPKWKVGDVVNIGKAGGGYKVLNKTGSWYNLEKNGEKYVFIPFQGLRKVRKD